MSELFDQIAPAPTIDDNKDYFAELVGEGKKFKDVKDLAKGKAFSDAHIANLEQTLARMREDLAKRTTEEDLLTRISLLQQRKQDSTPLDTPAVVDETPKQGLTAEDVERMLAQREAEAAATRNLTLTTQKLKDVYGERAAQELQAKANELGVDTEYMKQLAKTKPSVFLSLFTKPAEPKDVFAAPPSNSFRPSTEAYVGEKWSEFNKVKATDPSLYWSAKFQRRIVEAGERAMANGTYDRFMSS